MVSLDDVLEVSAVNEAIRGFVSLRPLDWRPGGQEHFGFALANVQTGNICIKIKDLRRIQPAMGALKYG